MNNPLAFTSPYALPENQGMELRDYLATHAMQALIDNDGLFSEIPTQAYALADAMLAARESNKPSQETIDDLEMRIRDINDKIEKLKKQKENDQWAKLRGSSRAFEEGA